jgi:carbon storage regulator CsrA
MLVLSRRPDESLQLPNLKIKISVLKVRRSSVVLGIEAPSEVRITRSKSSNCTAQNGTAIVGPEMSH